MMGACRSSRSLLQRWLQFCRTGIHNSSNAACCSKPIHTSAARVAAATGLTTTTEGQQLTISTTSSDERSTSDTAAGPSPHSSNLSSTSTPSSSSGSSQQHHPSSSLRGRTPPKPHSSLDKKEAAKFAALADQWWDKTRGPFVPLHALNAARCKFVRQAVCSLRGLDQHSGEPLLGLTALDVGCGGGLLSEPVARLGAKVHGIDVSAEGVAAAAAHAAGDPLLEQRVRYQMITLEELVAADAKYDIVMASEVIEHVRRPQRFLADLAAVTQPGGQVFITTINRTPASYAVAILGAEYLLGFVPRGTHDWTRFITPQELAMMAVDAGLRVDLVAGMHLDVTSGQFKLGEDVSVNYAALLSKQ